MRRENASLNSEIESTRKKFDIKLRSLRQDYERMRTEYEIKVKTSGSDKNGTTVLKSKDDEVLSGNASSIRSLGQALLKIQYDELLCIIF